MYALYRLSMLFIYSEVLPVYSDSLGEPNNDAKVLMSLSLAVSQIVHKLIHNVLLFYACIQSTGSTTAVQELLEQVRASMHIAGFCLLVGEGGGLLFQTLQLLPPNFSTLFMKINVPGFVLCVGE